MTLGPFPAGPNPWKIALLLEELNVPYTTKIYTTPELKQPAFLALNRNNNGLLLAEVSVHGLDCTQAAANRAVWRYHGLPSRPIRH